MWELPTTPLLGNLVNKGLTALRSACGVRRVVGGHPLTRLKPGLKPMVALLRTTSAFPETPGP